MPPLKNMVKVNRNISTDRPFSRRLDSGYAPQMFMTTFSAVPVTVYSTELRRPIRKSLSRKTIR